MRKHLLDISPLKKFTPTIRTQDPRKGGLVVELGKPDCGAGRSEIPRDCRGRAALLLAAALISLLLAAASADGAVPAAGEDLASATGPVAGETTVAGTFESSNEENWWYVQLAASSQVTFTASVLPNATHNCFGSDWNFTDYFGKSITSGYFIEHGEKEQTYSFKYTTPPTPSVGTYYVERAPLDGGVGCSYTWSISPASVVSTTPPPAPASTGEVEPNDQAGVASGPLLVGQLLNGTISTSNDVDNVFFNGLPTENLTLEMTGHRGCSGNGVAAKVTGPFGTGTELAAGSNNRSDRALSTAVYGGRYNVAVSGQQGCRWQLQVVGGTLSSTPVLPLNGGAEVISAAPNVVFGQTHQGGDVPSEYWRVPGMFPGDHLLLSFTNPSASHLEIGLDSPSVTDLFADKAKPSDTKEERSVGPSPVILQSNFTGAGTLLVRDGGGSGKLPAFSFIPLVLAHRTAVSLGRISRTLRRHRWLKIMVRVRSPAGVPAGTCTVFRYKTRRMLAHALVIGGGCRIRVRFAKAGSTRVTIVYQPTTGWLPSTITSRMIRVRR